MSNDETTEEEANRLQAELEAALREVDEQRERAVAAERRTAKVESERDHARAAVEVLTNERDSARDQRDQFETNLEAVGRRLESVEARAGELQRQVTETERQLHTETAARNEAESDRDKLAERVAAQEVAHARTTAAFDELQEAHEVVVEANDTLSEQLNAETSAHSKTRRQRDKARTQASNRGAAAVALGVTTFGSLLGHAARK